MKITRTSLISGITRTLNIPCTPEQYKDWEQGTLIQNAMPNLTDDQREFIISGASTEEWNDYFGEEPPEDPPHA